MTQEDKELLLKDICARLPHGVKMNHIADDEYSPKILIGVVKDMVTLEGLGGYECVDIEDYKPYFFPLSSMTDEMLEELNANGFFKYRDTIANVSHLESKNGISEEIYTYVDIENISFLIEFFHSHHIDYRGLIEKGLAIDATGLNVY
jgi:hypothetical protein